MKQKVIVTIDLRQITGDAHTFGQEVQRNFGEEFDVKVINLQGATTVTMVPPDHAKIIEAVESIHSLLDGVTYSGVIFTCEREPR